jgi:Pvc16 N-terminal domain
MIHELDESLRKLVTRDAVNGSGVEVSFDAPTREWAARRNIPTVDLYLYDIREDLQRRDVQYEEVLGESGRVVERRPPPRRFKLSYLVTAWTQRPEDEHRLLSALLHCFLRYDQLPDDVLAGSLADQVHPILVGIALPPPEERSISDVWSALGGDMRAALDLAVIAPFDPSRVLVAPPPVEEAKVTVMDRNNGATGNGRAEHVTTRKPTSTPEKGRARKGRARK